MVATTIRSDCGILDLAEYFSNALIRDWYGNMVHLRHREVGEDY